MIVDNALTLRELKAAVDLAIERHGDHLPVELELHTEDTHAWANGVEVLSGYGPLGSSTVSPITRLIVRHRR